MDNIQNDVEALRLAEEQDSDAEHKDFQEHSELRPTVGQEQAHSRQNSMTLRKKNQEMKLTVERLQSQVQQLQNQISQVQEQHQQEINTSKRLRHQRDQYRSTAKGLAIQVAQLLQQQEEQDFYDSDQLTQEKGTQNQPVSQQLRKKTIQDKENIAASQLFHMQTAPIQSGDNKCYPDVPDFHGDRDRTQWESWQLHLEAKFRANALLYPTDQSRIDYIQDHIKSTAFNVIKSRCSKSSTNPYTTPEEVLKDLNNMYGEFDAAGTADATLHDPDFNMKEKETFDDFLTRYTSTIAPLQLREQQQISNLTRTISRRLRWQTINGIRPTSFQAYVQQLRQCDLNMRQADRELKRSDRYQASDIGYSTEES